MYKNAENTDPENLENPENPENRGSSINSENTIHSRKSNKKQSYDVGIFWVKKSPPKGGVFRGGSLPQREGFSGGKVLHF